MKAKNYVLTAIVGAAVGTGIGYTPTVVNASSWHSSAIPAHLRGHWYAKANPRQGVNIYRHYIHYSGEKSLHVKWKYIGNHFYKFYPTNYGGGAFSLHYFGPHRITMESFWHSYFK